MSQSTTVHCIQNMISPATVVQQITPAYSGAHCHSHSDRLALACIPQELIASSSSMHMVQSSGMYFLIMALINGLIRLIHTILLIW